MKNLSFLMLLFFLIVIFSACVGQKSVEELDRSYREPVKTEPEMKRDMLLAYKEIPADNELDITEMTITDLSGGSEDIMSDYLPAGYTFEDDLVEYSESIAQASYEDKVYVTVSSTKEDADYVVDELLDDLKDYYSSEKVFRVELSGNGREYSGYKVTTSYDVSFLVAKDGEDIVIVVYALVENADDAKRIARELGNGLPENVKREIWSLPSDPPFGCELTLVTTYKLDESYAAERGYAEWAKRMVGYYETDAEYDCSDFWIGVGFIDLKSILNAKEIYDKLYSEERKSDSERVTVKGYPGWYLDEYATGYFSDELNFRVGYYVVAVDGTPPVGKDKLLEFANKLQI